MIVVCAGVFGSDYVSAKDSTKITIKCTGDSLTEGYGMKDAHKAILGGSSYPSILYTFLNENGVNAVVENAGHGGENTATIISRLGGATLYANEDFVFDGKLKSQSIDNKITAVFDDKTKKTISFKYTNTDVNPILINNRQYKAVTEAVPGNKWNTFLYKDARDASEKVKAGSVIKLTGTSNNDLNIIFAGSNDSEDINIDDYVAMLKNGAAVNGNKCIIVGPHLKIYDRKNFVKGKTSAERKKNYLKRMHKEFGDSFIDLSSDWYSRALKISTARGYFSGYSDAQLAVIQKKLDKGITPAEFTVNNTDGNVHFNEAGYTVVAYLVFERMIKLGYISL